MADPLERLRALCLACPGATERLSHGEPTWWVRGRMFVSYADHHHDERVGLWAAAPGEAAETLIAAAPDRFFRPPYYGVRGWIGVYLDVPVDWDEVAAIVQDAHALIGTPRRR